MNPTSESVAAWAKTLMPHLEGALLVARRLLAVAIVVAVLVAVVSLGVSVMTGGVTPAEALHSLTRALP